MMKTMIGSLRTLAFALPLSIGLAACSTETGGNETPVIEDSASSQASAVRDISVEEAQSLISSKSDVVVLDVRTPAEFAEGHVEGATNVDFRSANFSDQLSSLDRTRTYVLHCKSGGRSSQALEVMKEQGFEDIAHMADGFDGWQAAGLPVQR